VSIAGKICGKRKKFTSRWGASGRVNLSFERKRKNVYQVKGGIVLNNGKTWMGQDTGTSKRCRGRLIAWRKEDAGVANLKKCLSDWEKPSDRWVMSGRRHKVLKLTQGTTVYAKVD